MHCHRRLRELLKGSGKHDGELKAERRLRTREDDPRLRQQLFDLDVQRRLASVSRVASV